MVQPLKIGNIYFMFMSYVLLIPDVFHPYVFVLSRRVSKKMVLHDTLCPAVLYGCMLYGTWEGGGRQDVLWLLDIIKIPGPLILCQLSLGLPRAPHPHPLSLTLPSRQHARESQSVWWESSNTHG